ncbi:hypothetical protein B566_EDAN012330 [Ephemera danica]|nr:hypothetical protein B566_EDAN012330 [Ephemera danica]
MLPVSNEVFNISNVDVISVKRSINSVKSNSIGHDSISTKMLIPVLDFIVPIITNMFNSSILDSIFPSCWKVAYVTPLPKALKSCSVSDFRPISILPILYRFRFEEPSIRSLEEVDIFCEVLNQKQVIKVLSQREIFAKLGPRRSLTVDVVSLRRNDTDELLIPLWSEIAYELRLKHELMERAQKYSSGEAELHFAGVHVTAAADEYMKAMEWLRQELSPAPLVFLVVCTADSMDWCRSNLLTEDVFFMDPVAEGCSGDQLAVFAACNHTILRYDQSSKFGVIASALAEKQYKLVLGLPTGMLADVPGWIAFNSHE